MIAAALARAQLREQRPWLALALLLTVLDAFSYVATVQVDSAPLSVTLPTLTNAWNGLVLFLIAFALGTGLATAEADDGTLAFLDALPVRRLHLFAAKLGVLLAALWLYPVLRAAWLLGLDTLSATSLRGGPHGPILAAVVAHHLLLVTVGVALGGLLGLLRGGTWLALGVAMALVKALERPFPVLSALETTRLAGPQLTSQGVEVDWVLVGTQAAVAAGGLGLTALFFSRLAGRPAAATGFLSRPVVSALAWAVTLLAFAVPLGLWALDAAGDGDGEEAASSYFPGAPPSTVVTRHYRFAYPASQSRLAGPLVEAADGIFEAVHQTLGVDGGAPITADLTGSTTNTAGTAYHQTLRLTLEAPQLEAVLAHETVHVVADRLAGGVEGRLLSRLGLFNEGLAHWVERRLYPPAAPDGGAALDEDALVLAALHRRKELRLSEWTDVEAASLVQDDSLKYPLGRAVVEALVRRYGPQAPRRLLEGLATSDVPSVDALTLWSAVFQQAGFELLRVFDDVEAAVEVDSRRWQSLLESLPRPRLRLWRQDDEVGVEPVYDGDFPEGWGTVVRFKPFANSSYDTYQTLAAARGEPAWRSASSYAGSQACVQAGVRLPGGTTLFESWDCLPLRTAQPWAFPPEEDGVTQSE